MYNFVFISGYCVVCSRYGGLYFFAESAAQGFLFIVFLKKRIWIDMAVFVTNRVCGAVAVDFFWVKVIPLLNLLSIFFLLITMWSVMCPFESRVL